MRRGPLVGGFAGAVLLLCAACTTDVQDALADATPAEVDGTSLWVQLPTGRLTVTVGEPVDSIPADEVTDGDVIEADEDHVFLPVRVVHDDLDGVPGSAPQADIDPRTVTQVVLDVGSGVVDVPFETLDDRSYLEVEQVGGLELEVTFDGVSQRVDERGRRTPGVATGLYDASQRTALRPCGNELEQVPDGVDPRPLRTCRYELWEYPYVEGIGWASTTDDEMTWVVATAQTWLRADQIRLGSQSCDVDAMSGTLTLRVDGAAPDVELPVDANVRAGGRGLGARAAFRLPAADTHVLEAASDWTCQVGDRSAGASHEDRVTARS